MNHKISRRLYQALEARYTADILDARARLSVYFESPVAIGEHPQFTEEIDKLLGQLESSTGKLDRALRLHRRGHRFESDILHHLLRSSNG